MDAGGLAASVDGGAEIGGDDAGAVLGGDVGEPAGAAARVEDELALEPRAIPRGLVEEAVLRGGVVAEAIDLQVLPALPLEAEVLAVVLVVGDEARHAA